MFNPREKFKNFFLFLKSKKTLSLIGFGLLVLGLIAGLVLIRYPQILQKKAAFDEPTLYFSPTNVSFNVGQEEMVEIYLYSGDELISGVDLTLEYQSSDLEITKIEPGSYLTESVLDNPEINNTAGAARFVYINTSDSLPSGEFVIARVFIRGKRAVEQARLSFASSYEISKESLTQEYNLIVPGISLAEGIYSLTDELSNGVAIAMIPQENEVSFGQEFDISIEVRTGVQAVDGAAAHINFDHNLLRVVSIEAGTTLPTILMNNFDNQSGIVNYVAGLLGDTISGTFTLATITFEPIQQAFSTNLVFETVNPRKTDSTYQGSSVLGNLIESVIVTQGVTPTLTDTPTPTPTNTNTPTPTPEPTSCGNGVLDEGEVCDTALNCIVGKDGEGCQNACLAEDGGMDGYPNSGRVIYCKNDCSGYDENTNACWRQCTSNPDQAETEWGAGSIKVGVVCPSGGIMNEQCVCEDISDAVLEFEIGFQGINSVTDPKPGKQVKVTLKQGDEIAEVFEDVSLTANNDGSYTGRATGVEIGAYDVLIKSKAFLQKNFGSVSLNAGLNSFDWTDNPLLAGDFIDEGDDYNVLRLADITMMINEYTLLEVPVTDENRLFDVVVDGRINIFDIGLVLSNWTDLVIRGDE